MFYKRKLRILENIEKGMSMLEAMIEGGRAEILEYLQQGRIDPGPRPGAFVRCLPIQIRLSLH